MVLINSTVAREIQNKMPMGFNFTFINLEKLKSLILFVVQNVGKQTNMAARV